MKKFKNILNILKVLGIIIVIILVAVFSLSYTINKNSNYQEKIIKEIKNNYSTTDNIEYANLYGNYYIFTTKEKVIVLNKEFKEVASEDKGQLAENKNDYQLIYKANKLMYEETILSKKAVTYKYYDSKTYKQLSKITLER